jgi:hypothetical protein
MSTKSKTRSKKSSKGSNFLSLLLCCTFGSGSLLDDKDGSRGGDRSDSEPQTERVLDRPSNRGDMGATTSDLTTSHHAAPSASDILSPDPGASSSVDGSIPLQPMAVSFFFSPWPFPHNYKLLSICPVSKRIFILQADHTPLLPPLSKEHQNKKCLVLDLDETLIHSSFKVSVN